MRLDLLHRDDHLAVFDKPSGLLVHRGLADDAVTALDLARDALGTYVYPVHRFDRGTSGALVFATTPACAAALGAAFTRGEVAKRYLALVRGVAPEEATIDHPVPKSEGGLRVPAITALRRLAAIDPAPSGLRACSLVEAIPATGRFHQIRRHLKHIHHPLIGDANYGDTHVSRAYASTVGLRRLALHAASVAFTHPISGERLSFCAPLPDDLASPFCALGVPASAWLSTTKLEPGAATPNARETMAEEYGTAVAELDT